MIHIKYDKKEKPGEEELTGSGLGRVMPPALTSHEVLIVYE